MDKQERKAFEAGFKAGMKKQAASQMARKLMTIDDRIWKRNGWHNRNDLERSGFLSYMDEVKKELDKKGITYVDTSVMNELTAENFHSLVEAIECLGLGYSTW